MYYKNKTDPFTGYVYMCSVCVVVAISLVNTMSLSTFLTKAWPTITHSFYTHIALDILDLLLFNDK